jgi:hypothetical protein
MKALYEGTADVKVIEFAILHHASKPAAAAAPAKAAPAKPAPAPKVYVQRVEVYRGRARIKAVTRDQLDNVIAQLTALKNNPALLTYAECQVQFPWDKEANKPA